MSFMSLINVPSRSHSALTGQSVVKVALYDSLKFYLDMADGRLTSCLVTLWK